ncbi:MAG: LytR C-terminal domain-containing protein [Acidimicrobiales bacterium]
MARPDRRRACRRTDGAPPVGGEGSPGEASVIGVVMIVFAVLIGAFLLAKGYESEGDLVAGSSPTTVASSSGPPPTGLTTTSTTAPSTTTTPLKAPADVTVRVANGGGEEGVALAGTEKLAAAGYSTLGAVDAPAQTASVVYYAAGFEGEAVEVAKVFDIPETSVEELPAAPPTDPGGADVLVILGPEQKLTN